MYLRFSQDYEGWTFCGFNSSWKNFVTFIGLTEPMRALGQKECNNEN